jgi:hypothetical protein
MGNGPFGVAFEASALVGEDIEATDKARPISRASFGAALRNGNAWCWNYRWCGFVIFPHRTALEA